jgi:hypothetical protein
LVDWLRLEWEVLAAARGGATAGNEGEVSMENSSASMLPLLEITRLVEPHAAELEKLSKIFGTVPIP